MLVIDVFKTIFKSSGRRDVRTAFFADTTPTFLNVGGGNKQIPIPDHYQSWRHLLLDIDPDSNADIVMDARTLDHLPAGQFDAVYCSHNLEHYFKHDVAHVLSGFWHVLKPDGFAEIFVPNLRAVLKLFFDKGMELEDVLYEGPAGPIMVIDVIYGWGKQIEQSGVDFYAHKTGFTNISLKAALNSAGFPHVWSTVSTDTFSIGALAFKQYPSPIQLSLLGLSTA